MPNAQSAQHQDKLILGANWMLYLASNFDSEKWDLKIEIDHQDPDG